MKNNLPKSKSLSDWPWDGVKRTDTKVTEGLPEGWSITIITFIKDEGDMDDNVVHFIIHHPSGQVWQTATSFVTLEGAESE